jgi:hypothetical protein
MYVASIASVSEMHFRCMYVASIASVSDAFQMYVALKK